MAVNTAVTKVSEYFFGKDPMHPNVTPQWDVLEASSVFSLKELKRLFARYVELCDPITGDMGMMHFLHMPEIVSCPFARTAFEHEAAKQHNPLTINFTLFVRILSKLSLKTLPTEKVQYLCEVSGTATTGNLFNKDDLRALLTSLNSTPLNDELLEPLIDNSWSQMEKQVNARRKREKKNQLRVDGDNVSEVSSDGGRAQTPDTSLSNTEIALTKGEVTNYLCSLDLQNFLTASF